MREWRSTFNRHEQQNNTGRALLNFILFYMLFAIEKEYAAAATATLI